MRLYSFWRSSAAFRVRIALNLKGVDYEIVPVHLTNDEHLAAEFLALNPQATVPTLDDDGTILWQSLAIIEYLDTRFPSPLLIPAEPVARARVQALAQLIVCEIHPLNNLRVLQHLKRTLGQNEDQVNAWYRHWIADGLAKLEAELASGKQARFCHGDAPTMADCCLVPQIFNAKRYSCELAPYPMTMRAFEQCMKLDAFDRAQPSKQPDAE
jgi:maleylacetoacetate isomerase/maleylpyruvate isomerase